MKKQITIAVGMALVGSAAGMSIEALPTHSVFYAGLKDQPCLRVQVEAESGERLRQLVFSAEASSKGAVSGAALYKSSVPFFSLHAEGEAAAVKVGKAGTTGGTMVFKTDKVELSKGTNYFWLVYDVAGGAKGGEKICGVLRKAVDGNGSEVSPNRKLDGTRRADGKEATPAEVFRFRYRIAPYVRPKWACVHNKRMFNAEHLKNMTDFIVFGYTHKGVEIAPANDALHREKDLAPECLAMARKLRGEGAARILAGFTCNERNNPMSALMHNAEKRRALAHNMAKFIMDNGYEGIDIDWEYPAENRRFPAKMTWRKFAMFLAELRAELAGTGVSISIAVTTRYDAPTIEVLDGVDFINSMSYGRPGEHSTKTDAQTDIQFLLKRKVPAVKVVLGLPFFSRDTKQRHDDKGGCGYSSIIGFYPHISPSDNTFIHPETKAEHFFNGESLIKDKCKTFVLQQKIGGVCIWAYDTDVPMNSPKSLSKALYSVIRQAKK